MEKVVLCILDGFGYREERDGNAILLAKTPNYNYIWDNYPHILLNASSTYVGLPDGQMGNSEVGHMNIGAGRIVYQELLKINKAISDETFFKNEAFVNAINNCKEKDSNLHLLGLVSDGGVHSHIDHLLAILDLCKKENFTRVYIHALLDGRDTAPNVGEEFVEMLENKISELGFGEIVTISGRYYTMNRDRNWDLTELGYRAVVDGESTLKANSALEVIKKGRENGLTDEFIKPTVIKSVPINNNDSIIAFNFRSDRMIQFSRALMDEKFNEFPLKRGHIDVFYVTMTEYEKEEYSKKVHIAFETENIKNTLGEVISKNDFKQLRLTEFEKRLHVTFYFSGMNKEKFLLEDNVILERDNVFTYDLKPEMRSSSITDEIIKALNSDYQLIVVNYPNGDAVGHSGNLDAAIKAVEALDDSLGRLLKETRLDEYTLIITADHGNCEYMIERDGSPNKKHTTNKVPFIICKNNLELKSGSLSNIAPTILDIMNIEKPLEMEEESLIIKKGVNNEI